MKNKYRISRISFIIMVFMMFSFFSFDCSSSNKTDAIKLLNGKWMLNTINGKEVVKDNTGGSMPYIEFDLTASSVSGNTGCNDLDGKFSIMDTEISFNNMSMSKIFCPDAKYEYEIVNFLFHSEPVKYKFGNNKLTLSKNEKKEMIFKKEE